MALKPKQQQAVIALLQHPNVEAAAKAVGIGERTLWRWIAEPEFAAAVSAAEGAAIDEATRRLVQMQTSSLDVLQAVLDDRRVPIAIRMRGAGMAIDFMLKLRELRNVEARLAALEAAYTNAQQRTA